MGLVEYIEQDFCRGADDEKLCHLDAGELARKLIDGKINEDQFARGTVELVEKHYGKAMVRRDDNRPGSEGSG